MAVVGELEVRVEADDDGELLASICPHLHLHPGSQLGRQVDVELLPSAQPQAVCVLAGEELQGDDAHPHQVAAVDALVALCQHRLDALQPNRTVVLKL